MGAFDQRPRFYEGQYLAAGDLSAIVDYLRAAQARQALGTHTWGIGIGLSLLENSAPGAPNRREVILQPGWACDGFGRALVVQQPTRLPESLFAAIPYSAALDNPAAPGGPVGRLVKVWLSYVQASSQQAAPGFQTCDGGDSSSRVQEGVDFVVGDIATSAQRDPVLIGADSVDAQEALSHFDPAAPLLYDGSVPQQSFPADDPASGTPPRWLVPIGLVRWVAGQGTQGWFVDRNLVPAAKVDAQVRALRRYVGTVTETIEAAAGTIVLRRRGDAPDAAHRYRQQVTSAASQAALDEDLVWVEGGLRAEGDVKLAGSRLLLRNADGASEGNELYLARYGDGSGLAGQRELRAVIGAEAQTDNRFVVGPELAAAPPAGVAPPLQAPHLVVQSNGRVGINVFSPGCTLHARGAALRLEDSGGSKRIELRTDGAAVDLRSDTDSLYLRATGPAATGRNHVLINPFKGSDGAVGIGTDSPAYGLDVDEAAVRFKLDSGNGGQLLFTSEAAPAARDKVYLEARNGAGNAAAPELRLTAPAGANLPLFSAWADITYLKGQLGVNIATPAADTQLHVRGPRIRLQSSDGARAIDLRTDGSAVDLQSLTSHLYLRSTTLGAAPVHHIVMNPGVDDGNVGIGTAAPEQKLHVRGNFIRVDGAGQEQAYLGGDGSFTMDNGSLTRDVQLGSFDATVRMVHLWNIGSASVMDLLCGDVSHPSDSALKHEVHTLQGGLATLAQLRGVSYRLREDALGREQLGFIAQEVAQVAPQAVKQTPHGLAVSYTRLVPLLVEAVKELQQQVQALQAQVQQTQQAQPAAAARPTAAAQPLPPAAAAASTGSQ